MAHPQMFDDDDPRLARVRTLALALPDAKEKVSHGRPTFFTTKVFATYGGSRRVDGTWVAYPHHLLVQPEPDDREALLQEASTGRERVIVPAYLGPSGWIGVLVPDPEAPAAAWTEVAELLDASYRRTAGTRRVALLDENGLDVAGLDGDGPDQAGSIPPSEA